MKSILYLSLACSIIVLVQACSKSNGQIKQQKIKLSGKSLKVAIYSWIPEAAFATEKLERQFEKKYPNIDLDIELFDPYASNSNKSEFFALDAIRKFDLVEIDIVKLDELIKGKYGGIDKIPTELIKPKDFYISGPSEFLQSNRGQYVIPHWVCGNFFVTWKNNHQLANAQSYEDFRTYLSDSGNPLFADIYGGGTLGEYYADAMLDIYGARKAKKHFEEIANAKKILLDDKAKDRVIKLITELPRTYRKKLSKYHYLPSIYPKEFAANKNSSLIGYSERLYHVERATQFHPQSGYLPLIKPEDIVVKQFSFSNKSKGTPTWIDGFVIPKGKYNTKQKEIQLFIDFVLSEEGYDCFLNPRQYFPSSNLMPASKDIYSIRKHEILRKYLKVFDDSFIISSTQLYSGIDKAGEELKKKVKVIYK